MNFGKYINIPYKHLGRSFEGADCWGLIWLIYKEERNITLPDNLTYKEFWYKTENNKNHLLNGVGNYGNKTIVTPPFNRFDGILFWNKNRTYVDHIGLIIEGVKFIHSYRNSSSKIDRLTGYWNSRVYKGVRWHR